MKNFFYPVSGICLIALKKVGYLTLIAFSIILFTQYPTALGASVTSVETPDSDLGVISVGSEARLDFTATYADSQTSMAIVEIDYNSDAYNYTRFTAFMDAVDVTSFFDVTIQSGVVSFNCSDIPQGNGTLTMEMVFTAQNMEGFYEFEWIYAMVGYQTPPNPPVTRTGTGISQTEIVYGLDIAFITGWNLFGVPMNPRNATMNGVFGEYLSEVEYVYGFDNKEKEYTYWIQGLPDNLQTISLFQPGRGYWVFVSSDFNATVLFNAYGKV